MTTDFQEIMSIVDFANRKDAWSNEIKKEIIEKLLLVTGLSDEEIKKIRRQIEGKKEEMNECEICGCNMTEENTRYVEDGDTIIMCDKCEE